MKRHCLPLNKYEFLRLSLLVLLCGATVLTLFKIWTSDRNSPPPLNASLLPEQINLQGWRFMDSRQLPLPTNEGVQRLTSHLRAGRLYQYRQGKLPLTVELWVIENTNGDVPAFIDSYAQQVIASGRQQVDVRYRKGVGFYGVLKTTNRLYLSSCINATGETTFNVTQFSQARFQRDLGLLRIVKWIFGQETLLQRKCLWSHLGIVNTNQNIKNDSVLENIWFDLYRRSAPILSGFR
jgi:cyanosortase A-associated protein